METMTTTATAIILGLLLAALVMEYCDWFERE
jgi:hypothetical protein